ncbi:MAG: hypothetical protein AAFO79_10070, partial [Pseudomonadota bacterium]
ERPEVQQRDFPSLSADDTVYLIDGAAYIFRAYFAMFKAAQSRGQRFSRSERENRAAEPLDARPTAQGSARAVGGLARGHWRAHRVLRRCWLYWSCSWPDLWPTTLREASP